METIYNLLQLIDLIEEKDLTVKQICRVLSEGFKIYADEEQDRETLIQELKEYDYKYKNSIEKPLFLGCEVDVDAFLKEQETGEKLFSNPVYKTTKAAMVASLHNNKGLAACKENNTFYLMGEPKVKFSNTTE